MDPTLRTDPEHLRRHQYVDSRNLDARFQLHDRPRALARRFDANGVFTITKNSGLFIASP